MRNWVKLLPILSFLAFLIKTILFSASFPESIILLGLISYVLIDEMKLTAKKLAEYDEKLKELKEIQEKMAIEFKIVQSSANAAKMVQGMRPLTPKSF